jgi:hypothetical protein
MLNLTSSPSDLPLHADVETLVLTPRWAREPVVLMPSRLTEEEDSPDDDDGGELSAREARWLFESCMTDNPRSVRAFVMRTRLAESSAYRMTDDELRRWVIDRIEAGELVAMRAADAEAGGPGGEWRALRELVRKIEQFVKEGLFRAGGRQYRLLVGADLVRLRNRDQFELATRKEAERALVEIAQEQNTNPALVPLLHDARGKLSRDWRPPLDPDGLVLLRRKVTNRVIKPADVPVLTPSQLNPREEKSWIEIELVDDDGEPVVGEIELTLPDGRKTRVSSNAKGLVRVDGISPGNCQLTIPEMDASGWEQK